MPLHGAALLGGVFEWQAPGQSALRGDEGSPAVAPRTWCQTPPGEREICYNPRGNAVPAQDGLSRDFAHIPAESTHLPD